MSDPLPSSMGVPNEMLLGKLDYSLPADAKSYSVKIQPSNISQVQVAGIQLGTATTAAILDGLQFTSQNVIFDIPCGQTPSTFLDNRFSTLNFRMNITVTNAGTTSTAANGYLRSHANAFFDRMYLVSGNGQTLEDISEYGLVNDTLINLQQSNSVRKGTALQYGFSTADAISQGVPLALFGGRSMTATDNETHSFSVPILSSVIGCTANSFLNIGRTSKLQLVFQTAPILPFSINQAVQAANSVGATFTVTLSDFSLSLEYIDVGMQALQMIDQTLVNNKAYIHGVTYRTAAATLNATSGAVSILAGIRASSVKSLFTRFYENNSNGIINSANNKYDSKNPLLTGISYNIGGLRFPQNPINPLINPSQAFRELQMAIGSFNSSQFTSAIIPAQYCKLSTGGTAQGLNLGSTQAYEWNTTNSQDSQSLFIFGEDLEIVAKRGLLSGLNCTSAPVFVDLTIASPGPINTHTVYTIAMVDSILIHDVVTGDIYTRI